MSFDIRKDAPLVSILVVTYNHAPYIRQCLDSILMQETDFPYELCIGEDDSTDGTREICLEYADRFPHVIKLALHSQSEPGREAYVSQGNYNYVETMKICRGKYVADCDGDDAWIDPQKLQKQIDVLEADPSICLVHSDYAEFEGNTGNITSPHIQRDQGRTHEVDDDLRQFMYNVLTSRYKIMTCAVVARSSAVRAVMEQSPELFKDYPNADIPMWCELTLHGSFAYIDESLAAYRILTESSTHSSKPAKRLDYYNRNEDLKLFLAKKHGLPAEAIRRQKIVICNRLALVTGDYSEVTQLYKTYGCDFPFCERFYYWLGKVKVFRAGLCKIYECIYKRRVE